MTDDQVRTPAALKQARKRERHKRYVLALEQRVKELEAGGYRFTEAELDAALQIGTPGTVSRLKEFLRKRGLLIDPISSQNSNCQQ